MSNYSQQIKTLAEEIALESSQGENTAERVGNAIDVVGDAIGELESSEGTVEERLETAEGDIDTLEGKMTTAEGDIDTLEGKMTTAESDIDTLEGKMTTAEGDIDTLEGKVAALEQSDILQNSQISTNSGDIDILEGRVTALEQGGSTAELEEYVKGEHITESTEDIAPYMIFGKTTKNTRGYTYMHWGVNANLLFGYLSWVKSMYFEVGEATKLEVKNLACGNYNYEIICLNTASIVEGGETISLGEKLLAVANGSATLDLTNYVIADKSFNVSAGARDFDVIDLTGVAAVIVAESGGSMTGEIYLTTPANYYNGGAVPDLQEQIDEIDTTLNGTTEENWVNVRAMATGAQTDFATTLYGSMQGFILPNASSGNLCTLWNVENISKVKISNAALIDSRYPVLAWATEYVITPGADITQYILLPNVRTTAITDEETIDVPEGAKMLIINNTQGGSYVNFAISFLMSEAKESVISKVNSDNFNNALESAAVVMGGTADSWVDITNKIGLDGEWLECGAVCKGMLAVYDAFGQTQVLAATNPQVLQIITNGAKAVRITGNIRFPGSTGGIRLWACFDDAPEDISALTTAYALGNEHFLGRYSDTDTSIGSARGTLTELTQELGDEVKMFVCYVDNPLSLDGYKIELLMPVEHEGICNTAKTHIVEVGDSLMGGMRTYLKNEAVNFEYDFRTVANGSETILANMCEGGLIPITIMPFTLAAGDKVVEVQWASLFGWKPAVNSDGSITAEVSYKQMMDCFFVGSATYGFSSYGKRVTINGVACHLMSVAGYKYNADGTYYSTGDNNTYHFLQIDEVQDTDFVVKEPTQVVFVGMPSYTLPVATEKKYVVFSAQNGGWYYYDELGNWDYDENTDYNTEEKALIAMENLISIHKMAYHAANGQMIIIGHQMSADEAHNTFYSYIRDKYEGLMKKFFGEKFISEREVLRQVALEVGRTAAQMTASDIFYCYTLGQTFHFTDASSSNDVDPAVVYPGNTHLNRLGCEAIANAIYRRMYQLGWLKQEPTLYDLKATYDELVDAGTIHVNS